MSDDDLRLDPEEARIEAILRSMSADDLELDTPPASIWDGIERGSASAPAPEVVIPLHSRRRPILFAAAAAAALVVIAGLAIVLTTTDPEPVLVAQADLVFAEGFDPAGAAATAEAALIDDDGRFLIRIDDASLPDPAAGDDLELWLIGLNGDEIDIIQPIGIVADPSAPGTFEVPADFDRDAYDTVAVDISIEPRDGDEAHSGRSIVRGPLQQA